MSALVSRITLALILFHAAGVILHAQAQADTAAICGPSPCVFKPIRVSAGANFAVSPNLAANPVSAQQLLSAGTDFNCDSLTAVYSSDDGGTTWSQSCTLDGSFSQGSGVVAFDRQNTAYIATIENYYNIGLASSADNGKTWTSFSVVVPPLLGGFADRPWLAIDDTATSPYANALYISTVQSDAQGNSQIYVSHSNDAGQSWTHVALDDKQVSSDAIDYLSHVVIGRDGTVYLAWMRCTVTQFGQCQEAPTAMMFSKSTDGGNTWTIPAAAANVTGAPDLFCLFYGCLPNTHVVMPDLPVLAVSGTGLAAHVLMSFFNWNGSQMMVEAIHSADGGATWSATVPISPNGANDQFLPWMTVAPDGRRVDVTWLDRRNDPQNVRYQPFVAVSNDGGATFSPARPLSRLLSDPNSDWLGNSFMGYYRTHISAKNGVYAMWPDTNYVAHTSQAVFGGALFK